MSYEILLQYAKKAKVSATREIIEKLGDRASLIRHALEMSQCPLCKSLVHRESETE